MTHTHTHTDRERSGETDSKASEAAAEFAQFQEQKVLENVSRLLLCFSLPFILSLLFSVLEGFRCDFFCLGCFLDVFVVRAMILRCRHLVLGKQSAWFMPKCFGFWMCFRFGVAMHVLNLSG